MRSEVDRYFRDATRWREEAEALREILLGCGLDEALKWGKPCYGYQGSNIAIIQKMKDFVALMFFKGALLKDPRGVLHEPGPNSRSGRRFELTDVREVVALTSVIEDYVREAMEVERAGLEVPKPESLDLCEELQRRLDDDAELKAAFEALTPGRQRGYNLYVSSAKQSATRERRIDKYVDTILAGKGMRDR